jgi:hypothetical protein
VDLDRLIFVRQRLARDKISLFLNIPRQKNPSLDDVIGNVSPEKRIAIKRRHDIQHNNSQHNDTQHKGLICDTSIDDIQHNKTPYSVVTMIVTIYLLLC